MGRKNNYDGYVIQIPVRTMAEVIVFMEEAVRVGLIAQSIGLRERDSLDSRKNRLDLIVDNGTDPTPMRIWNADEGIVDDFRFTRDDLRTLATEGRGGALVVYRKVEA